MPATRHNLLDPRDLEHTTIRASCGAAEVPLADRSTLALAPERAQGFKRQKIALFEDWGPWRSVCGRKLPESSALPTRVFGSSTPINAQLVL